MAAAKTLTRQQLIDRARNAAAVRESTDNLLRKLIERADQLTPEQLDRIAALLPVSRSRMT